MDSLLHQAARDGNLVTLSDLVQQDPSQAQNLDSNGVSPHHLAAEEGHLEIINHLLQLHVETDLRLICDQLGRNPLHIAAINGQLDALRELIRARSEAAGIMYADDHKAVNLLNAKDRNGFTILHLAVSHKHIEMVRFLVNLDGIEVNLKNSNGFTALDMLIHSNIDLEIADLLRRHGAKQANHHHSSGSNQSQSQSKTLPPAAISGDGQNCGINLNLNDSSSSANGHWILRKRDALMVVASVIATMAFQAAINPPNGLWEDSGKSIHPFRFAFYISSITFSFVFSIIELCLLTIDFPSTNPFFLRFLSLAKIFSIAGMTVAYGISILSLT